MSKLDSIKRFFIAICTVILAGGSLGVLGTLASPSVASASTFASLFASPNGTGTCTSSSSPCSLSTAITAAGGSTYGGDAVTIELEHADGSQCSTGSVCTFDGDFVVSTGDEASLTIEGTGTGSDSSSASVLNGGGSGETINNSAYNPSTATVYPVTLDNITVSGGSSADGGAGIANNGAMTVVNSTISENTATGGSGGGGVEQGGASTMTIIDSTISGNSSTNGGGGIANYGTMTVTDSTISGNSSTSGAGIYNSGGTMTVTDSTISGNQNGSGIYNPTGTVTVAGSIVADQTSGGNCSGSVTDAGYNLSDGGSCGFGTQTSTSASYITNLDLGTLASNGGATETIAIPGSSAAAAFIASPATVTLGSSTVDLCTDTSYTTASGYVANLSVDQRGVSRPTSDCSAGAYEQTSPQTTVIGINPTSGSTNGGTSVTITGANFTSGASVDFGNVTATVVTVNSSTSITAISPAESAGTVNITVTTTYGTSSTSSADQFTFIIPTVTSISPTTGSTNGGTSVTISGANFTSGATVYFGSVTATATTVNSSTSITVISPAESAGTVNVTVTTAYGASATSSADQFTFVSPPSVSTISPTSGATTGGASVTITGTGFTSSSTVDFGSAAATSVTYNSPTSLTTISPAESAGTVNVTVTTAYGTSATSSADQFTFVSSPPPPPPVPIVTGIAPRQGGASGGTMVLIEGSNLFDVAYVFFGNTAATSFSIVSSTEIQAVSPPMGRASIVNVTVTSPGGTSAISPADRFFYPIETYPPEPIVKSVTPASGPAGGGTPVAIFGYNFTPGATVMFGLTPATSVTYNSPGSITAISPAESAGWRVVNVTVATAGGISSAYFWFTYLTTSIGDAYTPINPQRLADTRCSTTPQPSYCSSEDMPSANASLTPLAGGASENVTVTGIDGIPSNATAVVINVTAVDMSSDGYLTIYPQGATPAVVSSLNWTANSGVVTNLVTVPVNTSNGEIAVTNGGVGSVDYVVDIEGYYAPQGSAPVGSYNPLTIGLYNPVTPSRLADTRCNETSPPGYITSSYCASLPSTNSNLNTLGTGQTENVTVTGIGGIPSSGVSAVVLNLTAIRPTHSGYLTVFPTGATKAVVSTVDFNKGESIANRVIVNVGSNRQISIYNFLGNTNFAVDVSGYYTDGSSGSQTGSLFNPVTPARILDTRCNQSPQPSYCASENLPSANTTLTAIPGGGSIAVQVAGEANIPTDATAVVGNLTAVSGNGSGYLTVYSATTAPATSDVNFSAGSDSPNMVISGLSSSGGLNIINGGGHKVNVLFDVSGYFAPATA